MHIGLKVVQALASDLRPILQAGKNYVQLSADSGVLAALYSKHIYAFSSQEKLETVFQTHILSQITMEEVPDRIIYKYDSIYIGLIYQLIKQTLISKGMHSFAKNKVYNPNSRRDDKRLSVL